MNTLKAEKRSTDEKAKKLRREGFVTGNLFGREIENSIMLKLSKKDVEQLLKVDNKGSQVMLEVDGKQYDALIKDIQYNAMARRVDEIDFQALVSNEKVWKYRFQRRKQNELGKHDSFCQMELCIQQPFILQYDSLLQQLFIRHQLIYQQSISRQ